MFDDDDRAFIREPEKRIGADILIPILLLVGFLLFLIVYAMHETPEHFPIIPIPQESSAPIVAAPIQGETPVQAPVPVPALIVEPETPTSTKGDK